MQQQKSFFHFLSNHGKVRQSLLRAYLMTSLLGGLSQYGPDGILGPTKYLLILKHFFSFFSKKHDKIYHHWNQTITEHFWWVKMRFFLYSYLFFLCLWSFSSGSWARQDSGPDNLGGHVPPRPPIKYAHGVYTTHPYWQSACILVSKLFL